MKNFTRDAREELFLERINVIKPNDCRHALRMIYETVSLYPMTESPFQKRVYRFINSHMAINENLHFNEITVREIMMLKEILVFRKFVSENDFDENPEWIDFIISACDKFCNDAKEICIKDLFHPKYFDEKPRIKIDRDVMVSIKEILNKLLSAINCPEEFYNSGSIFDDTIKFHVGEMRVYCALLDLLVVDNTLINDRAVRYCCDFMYTKISSFCFKTKPGNVPYLDVIQPAVMEEMTSLHKTMPLIFAD